MLLGLPMEFEFGGRVPGASKSISHIQLALGRQSARQPIREKVIPDALDVSSISSWGHGRKSQFPLMFNFLLAKMQRV